MAQKTMTDKKIKTKHAADGDMIIDTSQMNQGQRAAMEVAEAARDELVDSNSFAGDLFMGRFDGNDLIPFPKQTDKDKAIGDEMVRKVSKFLANNLDPDEVDETRTIPDDVINTLKELGVFKMKVPQEYGGLGFSQINYNRVLMAIASYCGSTAVVVSAHQSIGIPTPLKMCGTEAQKKKFLTRIAKGDITAFALTEPDVGSDPAQMKTTAELTPDGKHYIINGTKLWTTNGPISQQLVVMAQTPPKVKRGRERSQITAFIVETSDPGVKATYRCDFMGIRAIHNGLLELNNVKVPVENVIWGEGMGLRLALKTLNTGRLTLPAACTGMGKQCVSIVRQWGSEREQWGLPIGKHDVGSQKIAEIAATTFAMEAITELTSHWADEGRDNRVEAAMAKLFCSEAAWQLIDTTMQFRGGRGYERAKSLRGRGETPWPVERMMRDCRINRIIEGTTDIMRLFLAREALDPHLRMAADILRRGEPMSKKFKAGLNLAGFYCKWYTEQVFGKYFTGMHSEMGKLAKHFRYVDRTSHRLAQSLFHAMARYQQKLEREQVLLAHLMEIGTELFAMSVTCAYANSIKDEHTSEGSPEVLADVFCRQAKLRIKEHFRVLRVNRKPQRSLSKGILKGDFKWMEKGVIRESSGGQSEKAA